MFNLLVVVETVRKIYFFISYIFLSGTKLYLVCVSTRSVSSRRNDPRTAPMILSHARLTSFESTQDYDMSAKHNLKKIARF